MPTTQLASPTRLREAMFYERLPDGRVHCRLCPHDDRIAAAHLDPIEKKPLFHFFPGSTAYSIATVGCCLRCTFCQNWDMSQWPRTHLPRKTDREDDAGPHDVCPALAGLTAEIPGSAVTPQGIVDAAARSGARSI